MNLLKAFGLALLVAGLLGAADPALQAQGFAARLLGQEDGLASPSITSIAQDQQGYLWVATENGVFRYSGSYFEEFSRDQGLSEPAVYTLLVDRVGTVWAGTHNGLFWYGGQRFREVLYNGHSLRIGMNSMMAATATGELVVQTAKGTLSLTRNIMAGSARGESWTALPYAARHPGFRHLEDTNGVGLDGNDHLLIGCGEAICATDRTLGVAEGVPPDYYMGFFRARNGQLWARGRKHIVTWRDGDAQVRDLTGSFPAGAMRTLFRRFTEDAEGNMLTPTAEGFATWDGHAWTETDRTSQGPLHGTTAVFADREGSVWVGTEGAGLLESLGYRRWANYGTEDGLSSPTIDAIGVDGTGRPWIGTRQFVNLLLPAALSPLGATDDALSAQAFAATPDGGMWTGSLVGSFVHTNAAGRVDMRTSLDAYTDAMLLDREGTLWIGTSRGLFSVRCKPGSPCTPMPFAGAGLGESMRSLALDGAGGLWAAGDHGLDYIEGGHLRHIVVSGQKQVFKAVALAPHAAAGAVTEGMGGRTDGSGLAELYLAGEAPGLLRVRVRGATGTVVETRTRPDLLSDRIQALSTDQRGRLWIATDDGIDVLSEGKITGITTEDGLASNDIQAIAPSRDGSVWVATVMGVCRLLDPEAVLGRPPFRVEIDQLSYNGAAALNRPAALSGAVALQEPAALSIPAAPTRAARPLRLKWNSGDTVIRYSALTFRENRALVYHYRLYGLGSAGAVSTHASLARFPQLAPGTYTFRVVAEDPVHHFFSAPAAMIFTLTPPWYRSWVAYACAGLLCLGLAYLAWRTSNRLLLAQRRRLGRLVAERTREIEHMALRDSLTGVLNRRAIMSRLEEEVEYARRHHSALCVALIDLDHFKSINDTLGHLAGDEVLREAARRLSMTIRTSDAIGRYGGEEFVLLFRNVDREFGVEYGERVRRSLCDEPVMFGDQLLPITCSIGLAWSRDLGELTPTLIARADQAMYRAKQNGRNRVECALLAEADAVELGSS